MANLMAKKVKAEDAYEVYQNASGSWTFYVLKYNQGPEQNAKNQYAICNVACVTPNETDFVGHDTYVSDLRSMVKLTVNPLTGKPILPIEDREDVKAALAVKAAKAAGKKAKASQQAAIDTLDADPGFQEAIGRYIHAVTLIDQEFNV